MSRVSSKSSLSPSATRGSSRFDLGKDSGVDMGRKAQPSVTSGGIGVTQEVTNIGGVSITGGVSVEVSPVRLDISGSPNYEDPTKSTIGIAGGAEIPGGILGVSGGVTINTSTGEVTEVAIGGEIAGVGVSVSKSAEGGIGVSVSLQIPFTPIEVSVGFGFPPKKTTQPPAAPVSPVDRNPNDFSLGWKCPDGSSYYLELQVPVRGEIQNLPFNDGIEIVAANYEFDTKTGGGAGGAGYNPFNDEKADVYWGAGRWAKNTYHYAVSTRYHVFSTWRNKTGGQFGEYVAELQFEFDYEMYTLNDPFYIALQAGQGGRQYNFNVSLKNISPYPNCLNGFRDPTIPNAVEYSPSPGFPPFPNPPPKKSMDACCQEVLKFQRQMYNKLGLAKFPGELPSTIIQEVPNEGEEPAEPPQVPIPDLVSFMDWIFKRDDERWGQWEVQINVKDADVTQEGDQKKQVKFPNLAESIAEIEGQMLSLTTNVDALIAITTKNLVEAGLTRQEAIKGYLASKAMIKYMAFKTEEIDVAIPLCFTPGAETIHGLIAESELHLKGLDYTEKETLRDVFLDLLQAAAVIRAVHWQRIDTKKDTKSQLLGLLKGSVDLANSLKNSAKPDDGTEQPNPAQNFEDFLDSAESGFTNTTGITDIQNPYGKTPDRRPRIRQIGDTISQAGKDDN